MTPLVPMSMLTADKSRNVPVHLEATLGRRHETLARRLAISHPPPRRLTPRLHTTPTVGVTGDVPDSPALRYIFSTLGVRGVLRTVQRARRRRCNRAVAGAALHMESSWMGTRGSPCGTDWSGASSPGRATPLSRMLQVSSTGSHLLPGYQRPASAISAAIHDAWAECSSGAEWPNSRDVGFVGLNTSMSGPCFNTHGHVVRTLGARENDPLPATPPASSRQNVPLRSQVLPQI